MRRTPVVSSAAVMRWTNPPRRYLARLTVSAWTVSRSDYYSGWPQNVISSPRNGIQAAWPQYLSAVCLVSHFCKRHPIRF